MIKRITINDKIYPESLKAIENAPKALYLMGNANLLNSNSIAIIGSRKSSENGQRLAAKFATELSSSGITIVSGLALGIDTIAHIFSYDKKGKTIAVLGSGFNKIFPEENIELYKTILENDGLIITEYPPNEEAKSCYFLERNRIISGLSLGLLVIEALYRSGTSVTARLAIKQRKKVFTVPHEIWDSRGVGTNRLLKQGAHLITDTSDILHTLKLSHFHNEYINLKKEVFFDNFFKNSKILNSINSDLLKNYSYLNPIFKDDSNKTNFSATFSDPKKSQIYEVLKTSNTPSSPNDLAHKTGYSINEVLSILLMLEIDGIISKSQGGYICLQTKH